MPALSIHRLTDLRSQHGTTTVYPESACIEASSDVLINSLGVQRAGIDNFLFHKAGFIGHDGVPVATTSSVYVNGYPVARVGDTVFSTPLPCASVCIGPGSLNVLAGD